MEETPAPPLELVSSEAKEPQPSGGWESHGVKYSNQTHRSTSDPHARLYRNGKGKERKPSYLVHDLIEPRDLSKPAGGDQPGRRVRNRRDGRGTSGS